MLPNSNKTSIPIRITALEKQTAEISSQVDVILDGFPNKDPNTHRIYHAELIDNLIASRARWREVITFSIKSLIWASIVAGGSAIWSLLKMGMQL